MQTAAQTDSTNADNATPPLNFGFFSTENCVRPEHVERYEAMCTGLQTKFRPFGAIEEMITTEIIRSAWRLERCVMVEHKIGLESEFDPMLDDKYSRIQANVDRARNQAQTALRRAMKDLRDLQTERWLQSGTLPPDYDASHRGIACLRQMLEARLALARLKKAHPPEPGVRDMVPDTALNVHTMICRCGSGLRFKKCCGDTQVHRR
jgi:hypothetical protein